MLALILGVIAIAFGSKAQDRDFMFDLPMINGFSSVDKAKYGGDAYTGIQNASASAANNVLNLAMLQCTQYKNFMTFIGITMMSVGSLTIVYGTCDKMKKDKK